MKKKQGRIECMVCGRLYFPNPHWRHNKGICSPECRIINIRRIKRKYKKSDKGLLSEARWRENPERAKINKRYMRNSKYAQEAVRRLARLYVVVRKSDWWKEESSKGCRVCGTMNNLGVDHIIARVNGGTDDFDNLQVLCNKHNGEKWIK